MVGREGGSTPQIAKLRVRGEGLHQRALSMARTESQTPEPYTFLRAHEVLSAAQGRSMTTSYSWTTLLIANVQLDGGS